jgi:hypothetical protein
MNVASTRAGGGGELRARSRRPAPIKGVVVAVVFGFAVLLGGAVRALGSPPPPVAPDVYAVVVGYNGGGGGLPPLRFADDDAVRFALLFAGLDAAKGRDHVWLLSDLDAETTAGLETAGLALPPRRSPTRAALFAALDEVGRTLAARPRPDGPATLYVVYAGHGLKGRILMKPDAALEAAVTGRELRAAVAEVARAVPALRTFLFLDACRSQSLFTERGAEAELGPDLADEASALEARANAVPIGVLTAATSGKPAGEVQELGAGYFSHVLASGLAGAADADGDDVVSFGELAAFVAFNTERLTGQRPWFSPPGGDLGAPAMDHRGRRTRLDLSGAASGRYLVEAAPGRPVFVEAWKGDRHPLRLTLPPGRYRILHAGAGPSDRTSRAEVTLTGGTPSDLSSAAWADAGTEGNVMRGGTEAPEGAAAPVFSAAFTPDVVSTLTAGYDAGRAPPMPLESASNTLAGGVAVGPAPLQLSGAELQAWLSYRRSLGRHLFAGARLRLARSTHAAIDPYELDRVTGMVGAGGRLVMGSQAELAISIELGGGPVLRRGDDVSGDLFAPVAAARASLTVRLWRQWAVQAAGGYAVQWIRIDGARHASSDPVGEMGVAFVF